MSVLPLTPSGATVVCRQVAASCNVSRPVTLAQARWLCHGNSAIVEISLLKVLPTYPKLDGFVMDRVCGFKLSSKGAAACTQIKYWAVDKFHAYGHKKSCKCNPRFVKRLSRRFAKTNTAACEQVFSRFRNYARVLNESRPCRHQFKVLLYAKMHNEAITRKKASYLNKFTVQTKVKGKSYACTKKPAAKK